MKLSRFVLSALLIATPALADEGSYMALRGGLTSPLDLDYSRSAAPTDVSTKYDQGYSVGGAYGKHLGIMRVEAEGLYQQADVDVVKIGNTSNEDTGGEASLVALMVNGYMDIQLDNMPLKPYVGGGVGGAHVSYNKQAVNGTSLIDESKTAFAYQGIAGVRYAIDNAWDMTMEYRYFATEGLRMVNDEDTDYKSHSIVAGLSRKL